MASGGAIATKLKGRLATTVVVRVSRGMVMRMRETLLFVPTFPILDYGYTRFAVHGSQADTSRRNRRVPAK
jgi:hypothetical protein